MKPLLVCVLVLSLSAPVAFAGDKKGDISISFSSDDSQTRLAPRHVVREARLAITTRNGDVVLLLTNDVVAVQLSDAALVKIDTKEDAGFFEDLIVSGVRLAVGKAVEYPIAKIRSAEIRNGVLALTNDQGKPVFDEIKVNGDNVTRSIAPADAAKFVNAFRQIKSRR
ncbi:MAG TPA: hypothetical protein VMU84_02580 [Thermoanaerobaculia bacterium]|nr:hypothetical protein [Thermoanaerobaculia bacterium]